MALTDKQMLARKRKAIKKTEGGCVENMICPECGHYGSFRIEITVTAMTDVFFNGTDDVEGDHEWGDDSPCECPHCNHAGVVKDFTIPEDDPAFDDEGGENNADAN